MIVKLSQLKPFERNPRLISKDAFEKLVKSLQQDGYHQRIIATPDMRIVGGHQRIRALKKIGLKQIEVLVPTRDLTDEEFRRILIRDNLPFGEFDMDILGADYERDELIEIGMPEQWLPGAPDLEPEGEDDEEHAGKDEEVEPQIIHCPACKYEFSIMTEKKNKK